MIRRARPSAVLAIIVGGAAALIGSTQTWLQVALVDDAHGVIDVAGADAMALLAPLSLAALALGLALTIVGTVLRYVFGALAVAIGGTLLVGAWRIAVDRPVAAFADAVTDATGLAGHETVGALVSAVGVTAWPWVAVVAAGAVAAGGVLTLVTAHGWRGAGRRYRTDRASAAAAVVASGPGGSRPHDAIDSWDDLSRGDDPTA